METITSMEVTTFSSIQGPNSTVDPFKDCELYKVSLQVLSDIQITRVVLTWIFFLMGLFGNIFLMYCLLTNKTRSHVHVILLNLVSADLAFTLFTLPMDAAWNITMSWNGGEILCKICQMLKQFSMYISSMMVVVVALDRMVSIVLPMCSENKRTKLMLISAWVISFISSIPPAVLFKLTSRTLCPGEAPFVQCVDSFTMEREDRTSYYFFTMIMSFLLPLFLSIVSYSLILYEITNMQRRDRALIGRTSKSITRAKQKTIALTSFVSFSFLIFWGPYYGFGIYTWFYSEAAKRIPRENTLWLFLLPYFRPTIHPLIYGLFMKDVKQKFTQMWRKMWACCHCGTRLSPSKHCFCFHQEQCFNDIRSSSVIPSCGGTSAQTSSTKFSKPIFYEPAIPHDDKQAQDNNSYNANTRFLQSSI